MSPARDTFPTGQQVPLLFPTNMYQGKWAIFCDWCYRRGCLLVGVSVQQIADFLMNRVVIEGTALWLEYLPNCSRGHKIRVRDHLSPFSEEHLGI